MTTTLIPDGPDFRGYWLNPKESSWSRLSCPGGQTATLVSNRYQACCPISPGEACTIATRCKQNTLFQSVVGKPPTTPALATPCRPKQCVVYAGDHEDKKSNARLTMNEFACEDYNLGDLFGRLTLYNTVTALLNSHATPDVSTLTSFSTSYCQISSTGQIKHKISATSYRTSPKILTTITGAGGTFFGFIPNGKTASTSQTLPRSQVTTAAPLTITVDPVTSTATILMLSTAQLSSSAAFTMSPSLHAAEVSSTAAITMSTFLYPVEVSSSTTALPMSPFIHAVDVSSSTTETTCDPSSETSFPIETGSPNSTTVIAPMTLTSHIYVPGPSTDTIESAASDHIDRQMSKIDTASLATGMTFAMVIAIVLVTIVVRQWRRRNASCAERM
ncbi:NADP-dependent malic enzyme [Venturia inaequalis]|uniref:Uncharacterized protein n=1 Tax=Venturia inaequalis TaxID=5025 RepID=A0A8H3ZC31_VENIN|nr:hypothetical protein EG327_000991 [Venturia inaequalis]RDI81449.1 NADP-dependent malic enzyme [Venturia inaequalis]